MPQKALKRREPRRTRRARRRAFLFLCVPRVLSGSRLLCFLRQPRRRESGARNGFLPSRLWQKVKVPLLSYPVITITPTHTGRNRMNQNIPSTLVALIPLLSGSINDGYNRMIKTIILCNAAASGDTDTVNALLARHPRLINHLSRHCWPWEQTLIAKHIADRKPPCILP